MRRAVALFVVSACCSGAATRLLMLALAPAPPPPVVMASAPATAPATIPPSPASSPPPAQASGRPARDPFHFVRRLGPWRELPAGRTRFLAEAPEDVVTRYGASMQAVVDRLGLEWGVMPPDRAMAAVLTADEAGYRRVCEALGGVPGWSRGVYFPHFQLIATWEAGDTEAVLWHEATHAWMWSRAQRQVPRWLAEGMAMASASAGWDGRALTPRAECDDTLVALRGQLLNGRWIPFADLCGLTAGEFYADERYLLAYLESHALVHGCWRGWPEAMGVSPEEARDAKAFFADALGDVFSVAPGAARQDGARLAAIEETVLTAVLRMTAPPREGLEERLATLVPESAVAERPDWKPVVTDAHETTLDAATRLPRGAGGEALRRACLTRLERALVGADPEAAIEAARGLVALGELMALLRMADYEPVAAAVDAIEFPTGATADLARMAGALAEAVTVRRPSVPLLAFRLLDGLPADVRLPLEADPRFVHLRGRPLGTYLQDAIAPRFAKRLGVTVDPGAWTRQMAERLAARPLAEFDATDARVVGRLARALGDEAAGVAARHLARLPADVPAATLAGTLLGTRADAESRATLIGMARAGGPSGAAALDWLGRAQDPVVHEPGIWAVAEGDPAMRAALLRARVGTPPGLPASEIYAAARAIHGEIRAAGWAALARGEMHADGEALLLRALRTERGVALIAAAGAVARVLPRLR